MSDLLNYTTEEVVAEYDRLRDDCGLIDLPNVAQLTLTGDDRKGWLQGQVTNNLRSLDLGASSSFCFCEATGHLVSVCEVWSLQDRFLLTLPKETLPRVLERVEQMVILEDVAAADSSEEYRLLSIQGPRATAELSQFVSLPSLDAGEGTVEGAKVYCLRSNRTGLGGWDVWVPAGEKKALKKLTQAFQPISQQVYDIARLEAGIPLFGVDMNHRTLPPEMGPAFVAKHISYNKGCYMGQEVLMRMHSRGHTNRTWMALYADEPLEAGAAVSHSRREDAGTVTSAAFSPDYGHIGAAMLRNEAAQDRETVRVTTKSGDVEAEVRLMPILRLD
jgi:folate-binding protein YgfZ